MQKMRSKPDRFDVIVIGAGPGGTSVAYHLARSHHRVLLVEKCALPRDKACGGGLTRGAIAMLEEMGLTKELAAYQKVRGVRVIANNKGSRNYLYEGRGSDGPDYGLVVPRQELDGLLCQKAVEAGVILWDRTFVTDLLWKNNRISGVKIQHNGSEQEIEACFVVAADGGNSHFAKKLGLIKPDRWSTGYALRGYYADIPDLDDVFRIHIPLLDSKGLRPLAGYGWVFPLGDSRANIGVGFYPTQQDDLKVNLRRVADYFMQNLKRSDPRFADMKLIGTLRGAPLFSGLDTARCASQGLMLVGDAAGLIDPFTGEGIGTALRSGKLAAQVMAAALSTPDPTRSDLREYGRLLDTHFGDRFQTGKRYVKIYGLIWKLVDSTFDVESPLFSSLRQAIMGGGNGDSADLIPIPGLGKMAWLSQMDIGDFLKQVKNQLDIAIDDRFPLLLKTYRNLLDPTGSFLRSALMFLSAQFGRLNTSDSIMAATSLELLNLSYVIHTQIQAGLRKTDTSKASQGINWGNMFTVMAGDYFLVKSYGILANLGSEISQIGSQAYAQVCNGTLLELEAVPNPARSMNKYLDIIEKRTATFYELACRIGANLSQVPEVEMQRLAAFGRSLGLAFQLYQDRIKVRAEHDPVLEQPLSRMLSEDTYNLPLVYSQISAKVQYLKNGPKIHAAGLKNFMVKLRINQYLGYTEEKAKSHLKAGKESLSSLPDIQAKAAMITLADFIQERAPLVYG